MSRTPPDWAVRTEADRLAVAAGYYWDAAQADRVIRFAEKYIAPKYTRGAFQLFEWQRRFLMSLYGWRKPNGTRRFRWAVLHVPKKNGKTLLVSVIAAYEMFAAGEPDALVVSASTCGENAKQVYEQLAATIEKREELAAIARPVESKRKIVVPKKGAEYRALSAEGRSHEGYNCSCVIVDEAHAHRSQALFNCLRYSTAGRANGLVVIISTAGDDLTHFYYGFVRRARNVVAGLDTDPTFYAEVYEADPEKDDLADPAVWKRCNPSLDLYPGYDTETLRGDYLGAKDQVAEWLNFQRYRLNIFRRDEDQAWIDLPTWDRLAVPVPDAELVGRPCFLAFDGSQTTDPSTVAAVWRTGEQTFHVKSWAWVAEEGVRKREQTNLPRYEQYAEAGCMTITDGGQMDKWAIRQHIRAVRDAGHDIQAVALDATGWQVWGAELRDDDGFEMAAFPQRMEFFAEPTREFAAAVAAGTLTHDGGAWLRNCIHSVRLVTDMENRSRPARRKSVDKIDGAVAAVMAFGLAYKSTAPDAGRDSPPTVFLV